MWHPTPPVKHAILPTRWPSVDEAARSLLFSPLQAGPLALKDRTWVPAMVPWRATEDGFVTDDVLDWYERFARGRPGTIVVEATGVRDIPSGPLLRIGHDRFVPGLARLADRVRQASRGETRVLIQVIDFLAIRRRPDRAIYLRRYLSVTDRHRSAVARGGSDDEVREALVQLPDDRLADVLTARELEALRFGYRERVTDVDLPHVRELPSTLPAIFAAAAARAEAAGFDGVELHYAHAYTMASFLSRHNTRADGYGGAAAGRVRLPIEVYDAVRGAVGRSFAVGCRMLADECIEGGSTVDDAEIFAEQFARAGMDFISLSRGGKFEDAAQPQIGWAAYPYTGRSGWECMPTALGDAAGPFGRNIAAARQIRTRIRRAGCHTPIIVSGGLHTFEQMEEVLRSESAEIVAAARQSLADPDWFLKIREGRGHQIRRCTYTNYCEGLDQKHKQVTCKLWDREDLDAPGVKRTSDGKRRLTAPP